VNELTLMTCACVWACRIPRVHGRCASVGALITQKTLAEVMTTTRTSLGILSEQTCLLTHLLPLQRLGAAVCLSTARVIDHVVSALPSTILSAVQPATRNEPPCLGGSCR
jgi:hypothetical protein